MDPAYQHHCTATYSYRQITGAPRQETLHLIGTADQISESIAKMVKHGLENGSGPYTFSPIHPAHVQRLDER